MARRGLVKKETRDLYRIVWLADPFTLNRVEVIRATGQDSFPGSSSSAILEATLGGLAEGRPLKSVPEVEYLNPNVRAAATQLFRMRDASE